jgi:DNA-binding PadR family transcriptional regulator
METKIGSTQPNQDMPTKHSSKKKKENAWDKGNPYDFANLRPTILLLIADKKIHGFQLMDEDTIKDYLKEKPELARVYRQIKKFTEKGWIKCIAQDGKSAKYYDLTPEGFKYLEEKVIGPIVHQQKCLDNMLEKYEEIKTRNSVKG